MWGFTPSGSSMAEHHAMHGAQVRFLSGFLYSAALPRAPFFRSFCSGDVLSIFLFGMRAIVVVSILRDGTALLCTSNSVILFTIPRVSGDCGGSSNVL